MRREQTQKGTIHSWEFEEEHDIGNVSVFVPSTRGCVDTMRIQASRLTLGSCEFRKSVHEMLSDHRRFKIREWTNKFKKGGVYSRCACQALKPLGESFFQPRCGRRSNLESLVALWEGESRDWACMVVVTTRKNCGRISRKSLVVAVVSVALARSDFDTGLLIGFC